jgi:hypothetical protein
MTQVLSTKTEKILAVALAVTIIVAAAILISMSVSIHNVGKIKAVGVGVYWDLTCTSPVTEIDWGVRSPGDLAGVTVYIKNTKNTNATLSVWSGNWTPANASSYLTFSWNLTINQTILVGQVVPAQFQLLVATNITGIYTFDFYIVVTATEKPTA